MLAVRSLRLSHFRSYQSLELSLDARPVVLFGSNGAGKTNLLEAVSMLSPGRGMRRAKPDDMARTPEALGWKIWADLESLGQTHQIITGSEGGSRTVRIDEKTTPQLALGKIARVVWLVPVMDRLWVEGAADRRAFLDRLTMSFEPRHGEAVVGYEKAMRERNRLLKDRVQEPSWYTALEAQMARHGAKININRARAIDRLTAAQDGAATAFPSAALEIEHTSEAQTEDDLALIFAEDRIRDMDAGRTLSGPHRADLKAQYVAKDMEARLCSTGEQKALLVSLILSNARALAEDFGAPPILLLDEVAAHLDADRRAALYDEICELGAQAWMSGTGPELFEAMGKRAMMIEVSEESRASKVNFNEV